MEIRKFRCVSLKETYALAQSLSECLIGADVLGLKGDLGTGKTAFVQGLAYALKVDFQYPVTSPTFSLVHEYPCLVGMLYHMDFYRLTDAKDAQSLGLDQYFNQNAICAIEWFDRIPEVLPSDLLEVQFSLVSEHVRDISLLPHGVRSQAILERLSF